MHHSRFNSPIGVVQIGMEAGEVCAIDFHWQVDALAEHSGDPVLRAVQQALEHYFSEATSLQHIPYRTGGTPFQQKVWQALCEIPLGEVLTYGELAQQLGSSPRAVGGACRRNPIPLIIPCHRVVAQSGIGGFGGRVGECEAVDIKRWLLQHEGYG